MKNILLMALLDIIVLALGVAITLKSGLLLALAICTTLSAVVAYFVYSIIYE